MNKKRILIFSGVGALILVVAGLFLYFYTGEAREGVHDFRPADPWSEDLDHYEGWLVHSSNEFDNGKLHLTGWVIERDTDQSLVRRHVATVSAWNRILAKNGNKVVQFPNDLMTKHLPEKGEVS
ncbi:MAG TPA: hypothetical protein VFO38_02015 [Candidatus Saccharimonadales bacterium]|nr:hypothetical protein [Candidatus Saccharimonadales bacterium]